MIFDLKNKCHLNIEQQIKLLESRKLKINSYSKAKWYLDKYNYQSIINGYNDPFMENFDRKMNLYLPNSSFESIIELFNYDRDISHIILNNIHDIERTLSHKISYVISEEMCVHKYNNGDILNIDEKTFYILFKPNVVINSFKESLTKYAKKIEDKLFKKYNNSNLNNIPIWTLCLSWTFGDLINIFNALNKNLKKKIINSYKNISWNIDEFLKIMTSLNKIRNRTAHNNVLYNISLKLDQYMKPFFRKNFDLKIKFHSNTLALYDMIKIIDKISNKNNSHWSLMRIFVDKTNKRIKNSPNIPINSKEYIIKIMNFN